jgi:hypothetical protein
MSHENTCEEVRRDRPHESGSSQTLPFQPRPFAAVLDNFALKMYSLNEKQRNKYICRGTDFDTGSLQTQIPKIQLHRIAT